ncbi:CHAT domain-containing protein [Leptolyngbya sp. FACHB-36]|uniref:CHAT domain-containing protein n=1 Tax=Leptolyngbya sp. FACHB-36 TaxID=2692808 RepID=UPI001680090A|nr:CHAT domain-containing protein [Leptolyngbya sp. FACHB-36]MBD2020398.1 CHAT domain-containing protein [Leptolyngbya sp. FACHB-36]
MTSSENPQQRSNIPCLSLAIAPLRAAGHFAVHVIKAPYPAGYVLNDCTWSEALTRIWYGWQELFSTRVLPHVPHVSQVNTSPPEPMLEIESSASASAQPIGVSGRLMQNLGICLWQWLFDGPIQASLNHSQGIAAGQTKPLRLRLEVRDPDLIALPWEIMQDGPGKQAISLSQQLLFSRTTSDVQALAPLRTDHKLKILVVLGQDVDPSKAVASTATLKLEQEATALSNLLKTFGSVGTGMGEFCQVETLVQPSPKDLIEHLENQDFENQPYNVLFYAGHGVPAPDGGVLFLQPGMTLNGTELAQVLTRCKVKLAVFNACWGAQPDHYGSFEDSEERSSEAIPRSSLAEVLIHHGVPAVLGMREPVTDEEALSFIQAFAKALAERLPIDQAVAVARQHLLTLYKFNHPAWTLPVLYMHPQFDGELLKPVEGTLTQLPGVITQIGQRTTGASLRSLHEPKVWQIRSGMMRIGRDKVENDLVLQDDQGGISRRHAEIFCRHLQRSGKAETTYFIKDFSSYGTWLLGTEGWQKIHRQEVPLVSGTQLKFGSFENEVLEFVIHTKSE